MRDIVPGMDMNITPRRALNQSLAFFCSVAFLLASQYCALESFAAPHEHSGHDAAEHHDEHSPAIPGHHDKAVQCCASIQAVVASRANLNVASSPAWQLHPLALKSVLLVSIFEPARTTSGLSPPTQESPPARPFYRTTSAGHAPPVSLA